MRNTPLGRSVCAKEDGTFDRGIKWGTGITQGLYEDVVDVGSINYFGNPNEVECIKLRGASGIRINDDDQYRKSAKLAEKDNGWTVEEKCVEKVDYLTYNAGKDSEYHIPVPKCKEEKEAFTNRLTCQNDLLYLTTTVVVMAYYVNIFSQL